MVDSSGHLALIQRAVILYNYIVKVSAPFLHQLCGVLRLIIMMLQK